MKKKRNYPVTEVNFNRIGSERMERLAVNVPLGIEDEPQNYNEEMFIQTMKEEYGIAKKKGLIFDIPHSS